MNMFNMLSNCSRRSREGVVVVVVVVVSIWVFFAVVLAVYVGEYVKCVCKYG